MLGLSLLQVALIIGGVCLIVATFLPDVWAKWKASVKEKEDALKRRLNEGPTNLSDVKQELIDWVNQSDLISRWSTLRGEVKNIVGLADMRAASMYIPDLVDDADKPEVDECFVKILTAIVTSKKSQIVKPVVTA